MSIETKGCDLLLNGIPLMFFRGRDQAAMLGDSEPGLDPIEPATYADLRGGLGASDLQDPGMYTDGDDIEVVGGVATPAGERIEITDGLVGQYAYGFTAHFHYGSDLYLVVGRAVYRIVNGTSTTVQLVHDLGPGISGNQAVTFNGAIYIACVNAVTNGQEFLVKVTGDPTVPANWSTSATVKARYLAVVFWDAGGVPSYRLVGNVDSEWQLRTVSGDPMVLANWTAAINICDPLEQIRSLAATPRHVVVCTTGGVFDIDPRNHAPNLTPEWKQTYDIQNGTASGIIGTRLFVSRWSGLDMVDLDGQRHDIPRPVEPSTSSGRSYSGRVHGRPVALTTYRGKLITAFYNAGLNTSYVCVGELGTLADGRVGVIWQGSYSTVAGRVTYLVTDGPPVPEEDAAYLWIGTADAGTNPPYHVYRQYLAKTGSLYQQLLNGSSPRFQSTATIRFPDGWPDRRTIKRAPWRIRLESERLGGTASIDVALAADAGAAEPQGTSNLSPYDTFSARLAGGPALRVQPVVTLRGTPTQPAVFRSLGIDAILNAEQDDVRTYVVTLGREMSLGQGSLDPRDPLQMMRELFALQAEDAEAVTLIDEDEQQSIVQVLPGIRRRKVEDREGQWVTAVTFRVRILEDVWLLDTGVQLDTGRRLN